MSNACTTHHACNCIMADAEHYRALKQFFAFLADKVSSGSDFQENDAYQGEIGFFLEVQAIMANGIDATLDAIVDHADMERAMLLRGVTTPLDEKGN